MWEHQYIEVGSENMFSIFYMKSALVSKVPDEPQKKCWMNFSLALTLSKSWL